MTNYRGNWKSEIMKKVETYKLHFKSIDKSGQKNKIVDSSELSAGYTDYEISIDDFVKSIITCGMPMYYLTPAKCIARFNEIMYKLYALLTLIEFDPTSRYIKFNNNMKYLDSSEQATLSYYLGMVMTKYISYKEFGQDYLVHLRIMEKTTTMRYNDKVSKALRPDLLGYSRGNKNFSIFEAKGRQRKSASIINRALEQVQAINYIAGSKPSCGVAQLSFFNNSELYVVAVDPVDEGEGKIILSSDDCNQYILNYYEPILYLFDQYDSQENDNGKRQCSIWYEDLTIEIMMPVGLYNALKEERINMDFVNECREFEGDGIEVSVSRSRSY